jgi:hypothetical protein
MVRDIYNKEKEIGMCLKIFQIITAVIVVIFFAIVIIQNFEKMFTVICVLFIAVSIGYTGIKLFMKFL